MDLSYNFYTLAERLDVSKGYSTVQQLVPSTHPLSIQISFFIIWLFLACFAWDP